MQKQEVASEDSEDDEDLPIGSLSEVGGSSASTSGRANFKPPSRTGRRGKVSEGDAMPSWEEVEEADARERAGGPRAASAASRSNAAKSGAAIRSGGPEQGLSSTRPPDDNPQEQSDEKEDSVNEEDEEEEDDEEEEEEDDEDEEEEEEEDDEEDDEDATDAFFKQAQSEEVEAEHSEAQEEKEREIEQQRRKETEQLREKAHREEQLRLAEDFEKKEKEQLRIKANVEKRGQLEKEELLEKERQEEQRRLELQAEKKEQHRKKAQLLKKEQLRKEEQARKEEEERLSKAEQLAQQEAKELAKSLDACRRDGDDEGTARKLLKLAEAQLKKPDRKGALATATEARERASDGRIYVLEAEILRFIAKVNVALEEMDAAVRMVERELVRFRELSLPLAEAMMSLACADVMMEKRRWKRADRAIVHAHTIFEKHEYIPGTAAACEAKVSLHSHEGNLQALLVAARSARELYQEENDLKGEARVCRTIARMSQEFDESVRFANKAIELCKAVDDDHGHAAALNILADTCLQREGSVEKALENAMSSVDIAKRNKDIPGQIAGYQTMVAAYLQSGEAVDVDEALKVAAVAAKLARNLDDPSLLWGAVARIMDIHTSSGSDDKALAVGHEEAALAKRAGNTQMQGLLKQRIGTIQAQTGQHREAFQSLADAKKLFAQLGDKQLEASVTMLNHDLHTELGNREEAQAALEQARELYEEAGELIMAVETIQISIQAQEEAENYQGVLEGFKAQFSVYSKAGWKDEEAVVLLDMSAYIAGCAELGGIAEAVKKVEMARKIYRELPDLEGESKALLEKADLLKASGQMNEALQAMEESRRICEELKDPKGQATALQLCSDVHLEGKDFAQALKAASQARDILERDCADPKRRAGGHQTVAEIHLQHYQHLAETGQPADQSITDEAVADAEAAFEVLRTEDPEDLTGQAGIMLQISRGYYYGGHGDRALTEAKEALEIAESAEDTDLIFTALMTISQAELLMKNIDQAIVHAQDALNLAQDHNDPVMKERAQFALKHLEEEKAKPAKKAKAKLTRRKDTKVGLKAPTVLESAPAEPNAQQAEKAETSAGDSSVLGPAATDESTADNGSGLGRGGSRGLGRGRGEKANGQGRSFPKPSRPKLKAPAFSAATP